MSQHTPGPWVVCYGGSLSDDGFGIVTNNAIAERVKLVTECWPVAIVDHQHREELCANARLIAAAPELLEALLDCITDDESLALSCEDRRAIGYARRRIIAINEAARAAIAKATGVQS